MKLVTVFMTFPDEWTHEDVEQALDKDLPPFVAKLGGTVDDWQHEEDL